MALAIPIMMAISTTMAVVSAVQQGKAAKSAADFNAQVARNNATIATEDARIQVQQSEAEAGQVGRENYLRLGAIRAQAGHQGGRGGTGSVLDVLGDVAAQGELEKQNVLYQGQLQARSSLNKAGGYTGTAGLETASGANAQSAGMMKAGTELLSGSAKTYSAYKRI